MKTVDVYRQYFAAECTCNGRARHAALVTLSATSDAGEITYEAGVTFFPHDSEEDYAVSYDACASCVVYSDKGRRSKKREALLLADLRDTVDAIAVELDGTVDWDSPLREAQMG